MHFKNHPADPESDWPIFAAFIGFVLIVICALAAFGVAAQPGPTVCVKIDAAGRPVPMACLRVVAEPPHHPRRAHRPR